MTLYESPTENTAITAAAAQSLTSRYMGTNGR